MTNLEELATRALKLELGVKRAQEAYDEAKKAFIEALEAADMFNPDTKAIGPARIKITPNRFFDAEAAYESLPEDVREQVLVAKPDPKKVKEHLTPIQLEQFMKDHATKFKFSIGVLED